MRPSQFLLALVLSFTGFAIAIGASTAPAQGAQALGPAPRTFPDAPGKDAIQMLCSACHSPAYVTDTGRTPKEWNDIWELMQAYGAQASTDEWTLIRKYILGQLATIEINKAPAADLQAVFDIDEKLATAIVDYRMANGNFMTIEDVKKVPNLDATKVDVRKDRFQF